MKRWIPAMMVLVVVQLGSAQLKDSLWIYFQDGVGNMDSLLYGGRVADTINPDPKYNEEPFMAFDPVFEVGMSHYLHRQFPGLDQATYSKSHITPVDTILNRFQSYPGISVRIVHPPLKMWYDRSFFQRWNTRGAYITPDLLATVLFPDAHSEINRYECLADQDTLTF